MKYSSVIVNNIRVIILELNHSGQNGQVILIEQSITLPK